MPLFEFHCRKCDGAYEALIRNDESPVCPSCGSADAEKLLSTVAAHTGKGLSLPIGSACPPPEAGPCGPGCCRLPTG